MKYAIEEVRKAAAAWYDGAESPAQMVLLQNYFRDTPAGQIPEDLASAGAMMRGFGVISSEKMRRAILFRPGSRRIVRLCSAAAAVAAVLVAIALLAPSRDSIIYGYDYDGKKITCINKAMESAEYLSCLSVLDDNVVQFNDLLE